MASHFREEEKPKRSGGKALIIILCIIATLAVIGAGVFFGSRFLMQSMVEPAPTEATQAIVTEAVTQAPTEAPTEAAYLSYLNTMTDRDKLCQLFIVSPESITGVSEVTEAGEMTKEALEKFPAGGIVYFSQNLVDKDQTAAMISNTQSYSKTPLFIAVDEEGGSVARCAEKLGTTKFDPMYSYKEQGAQTAHDNAKTIGSDIAQLGFNLDFAPVTDVWTNPENTVIGERAYSDNFDEVSALIPNAVSGFHDGGVLCSLKHFPGHGDTVEDSHSGLAHVNKTAEELENGELLPFKAGIEAGADMVMVGHLVVESIDDKPATLSSKIVPDLLRQKLGYDGVVITDAMNMGAITQNYGCDEIVKGVFDADIDMILYPDDPNAYMDALEKALADGSITMEQVNAKVARILKLKYDKGIMK